MSLMKTLAKVAIGVAAAKGVGAIVKANQQGTATASGHRPGSGSVFGGTHSNTQGGGLEDMLGGLLGGAGGGAQGGLGGLLDKVAGGHGSSSSINDMLGGLAGQLGGAGASGGLGGLLGALTGGQQADAKPETSFGDLLNQAARGQMTALPNADQEAAAALMLRAMIQAAKSDGEIDAGEQQKLMERLSDSSTDEMEFVRQQLAAPVDIAGLARETPRGMEQAVYVMSVMAIDLDNQNEAKYLDQLRQGLNLDPRQVNQIHEELGVPTLYA